MAIISACLPGGRSGCPYCFRPTIVRTRPATVGAKIVTNFGSVKRTAGKPNSCRSIFGAGRRGVQEHNCASSEFISFMGFSFQTSPEFFQAIPIPARRRIGRYFQQLSNLFKSMRVPKLQHDDLTLGDRQFRQTAHGGTFRLRFGAGAFEPGVGFKFPRQPPPERPPVIQHAVPKTPHAVVIRLFRSFLQPQQRGEGLLNHVLGFRVGKAESAPIEQKFRCLGVIKTFAPRLC